MYLVAFDAKIKDDCGRYPVLKGGLVLVVGLTGGIASGKSTVCAMLERAGAIIIDADAIARRIVWPGQAAWKEIRGVFGDGILFPTGSIDRKKLGDLVFQDVVLRKRLEQIMHPRVRMVIAQRVRDIRRSRSDAVVVQDVPLLYETGMHSGLAEVIVVYVPEHIQLQRLMRRDGIGQRQALNRINAQLPMEEKRRRSGLVIDNSGSLLATEYQVEKIYRELQRRALSDKN
jgi:dephospho-CoA kinase